MKPDERPRWSFTWQLHIQRTGRPPRPPLPPMSKADKLALGVSRLFPWLVLLLLLIEIGLLVWLGVLPR